MHKMRYFRELELGGQRQDVLHKRVFFSSMPVGIGALELAAPLNDCELHKNTSYEALVAEVHVAFIGFRPHTKTSALIGKPNLSSGRNA